MSRANKEGEKKAIRLSPRRRPKNEGKPAAKDKTEKKGKGTPKKEEEEKKGGGRRLVGRFFLLHRAACFQQKKKKGGLKGKGKKTEKSRGQFAFLFSYDERQMKWEESRREKGRKKHKKRRGEGKERVVHRPAHRKAIDHGFPSCQKITPCEGGGGGGKRKGLSGKKKKGKKVVDTF